MLGLSITYDYLIGGKMEVHMTHDYKALIKEFKSELKKGKLKLTDDIKVVRTNRPEAEYKYVVIWYYGHDDILGKYEVAKVGDILDEMKKHNRVNVYKNQKK